jgi:hypothetical protein
MCDLYVNESIQCYMQVRIMHGLFASIHMLVCIEFLDVCMNILCMNIHMHARNVFVCVCVCVVCVRAREFNHMLIQLDVCACAFPCLQFFSFIHTRVAVIAI